MVQTAAQALQRLRKGMRVFIGSGCAAPQALLGALSHLERDLFDLEILQLLALGPTPGSGPNSRHHFRSNSLFLGPGVRDEVAMGWADYTPTHLSDIPRLFREGTLQPDVALITVSPPDADGMCSLGISVDIVPSALAAAKWVIAEINPQMPRTHGQSLIAVSEIDCMVHADQPLAEWASREADSDAESIGRLVAGLVEDGSTLQVGLGTIPNAILRALEHHRHLGLHSELFTEGLVPLIESGVLDGSRKNLLPGKAVASMALGSRRLYGFLDNNPALEFRPTEFVNDPGTIARNRQMVAIHSALQIDLTGQAASESIGSLIYSGFGGQADFTRGALKSEGGKSILAFPSTAQNGTISRIVPQLTAGTGVVTSRADIDFVVTEFGVAELRGKSLRERAVALIHLAHPKFRESLLEEARGLHLVHPEQIQLPRDLLPYPFRYETSRSFGPKFRVAFRPIKPTDEKALQDLFYSHSDETIRQRYFIPMARLPHAQKQRFVNVDYNRDMAIVGYLPGNPRRFICIGRYLAEEEPGWCEIAVTIHDDYQRRGLGTFLVQYLAQIGRERGIQGFTASFLATNHGMLKTFKKLIPGLKVRLEDGTMHVRFRLADVHPEKPEVNREEREGR